MGAVSSIVMGAAAVGGLVLRQQEMKDQKKAAKQQEKAAERQAEAMMKAMQGADSAGAAVAAPGSKETGRFVLGSSAASSASRRRPTGRSVQSAMLGGLDDVAGLRL